MPPAAGGMIPPDPSMGEVFRGGLTLVGTVVGCERGQLRGLDGSHHCSGGRGISLGLLTGRSLQWGCGSESSAHADSFFSSVLQNSRIVTYVCHFPVSVVGYNACLAQTKFFNDALAIR